MLRVGDAAEEIVGELTTTEYVEWRPALAQLLRAVADEIENGERL